MSAVILSGKTVSQRIKDELKAEVETLKARGIVPGLAVIIAGDDPASRVYVRNKHKICEEVGMNSEVFELPESVSEQELLSLIETLNKRTDINGFIVQLPLPRHINEQKVLLAIAPTKDVDAFHPYNVGKIMIGDYDFLPCTPSGIMELIKESGIELEGKEAVVIGRSNIVGKPMSMLLLHSNCTITVCHSKTKNLAEKTRQADILVAAVGRANFVTADMVKPGAVVIDVGMNRPEGDKLCGDVDFEGVKEVAGFITPVPGGVGLMTTATLMKNTLRAALLQNSLDIPLK